MKRLLLLICLNVTFTFGMNDSFEQVSRYLENNYLVIPLDKQSEIDTKYLRIQGNYALLSAPLKLGDNSDRYYYFVDVNYVICLEKQNGKWEVVYDLSGSDVPSDEELKKIRREFPKKFPKKLLPEFWQERLFP